MRVWVRTPLLSFLHTKQIGAGGPKPRHHSFLFCFWMCLRNHHQAETMSGVAQWLASWAHNPKVLDRNQAPLWSGMICFHASSVLIQCRITKGCSGS